MRVFWASSRENPSGFLFHEEVKAPLVGGGERCRGGALLLGRDREGWKG